MLCHTTVVVVTCLVCEFWELRKCYCFFVTYILIISYLVGSTGQPISVIIPTLLIDHSFSLSLQAHNLPFQQILPTLDFFYLLDCVMITGPDWTYYVHHFIFSFTL